MLVKTCDSQRMRLRFFAFLQQGVEEEIFKPLPPLALFDLSFGAVMPLVKRHIAGLLALDDALMQAAASACWDAITI